MKPPWSEAWSKERKRLAHDAFDFTPGSRFDLKVDIALRKYDPQHLAVPAELARELLDQLRNVEGLRTQAWYQPYGGQWPWPDDEPYSLPVPAPTPDWVVYLGFGLQVASTPAMIPVYINAMKALLQWVTKKREQDDERIREVSIKLTSKRGAVVDLGPLHAEGIEKLELIVKEELKE